MKKKNRIISFLVIVFLAFCAVGYFGVIWYMDYRMPAFEKNGIIKIYPGTGVEQVIADLEETVGVKCPSSIKRTFSREHVAEKLTPGVYYIKKENTATYIARAFSHGWESPVNLTIAGDIRSKEALAGKIASQMMMDSATILNSLRDSSFLVGFGTTPERLFELILPDTYQVYWTDNMEKLMARMKLEHDEFWSGDRVQLARNQGLSPYEASVLASIVAQESHLPDEYPKIASVYLTRLRKGMKLQACPTVCFIYNYSIRRVKKSHLSNPSPYNTYLYEGLPPAPICVPGKEHIEAVLHPASTPYLYFCADSSFNGRNVFSVTYAEHMLRAAEYQQALTQRQALRKAQADSLQNVS